MGVSLGREDASPSRDSVLHGRRPEAAAIGRLLTAARATNGSAIAVSGEPGIGKSALLDFAATQAPDFLVLRARGSPAETQLVFAGLHELLTPVFRDLADLDTPQGRALRTALGLAEGVAPDRFLVAGGLTMVLTQVAERQPVLCLVDDAQWLDQGSLDCLRFAAKRIGQDPIAVIVAGRPDDSRLNELPHLPLLPLDEAAARTLLVDQAAAALDRSSSDRVLALAAGNPLALVELGRAPAAGVPGRDGPGRVTLSTRLQRSFLQRVDEFGDETQQLLLLLACADTADRAWLTRAAGRHGLSSTASLDGAERAGLVRAERSSVRFAHPLVREAVYARASPIERAAAHRSLGVTASDRERSVWHRALAATAPDHEVADDLVASAAAARARGAQSAGGRALVRAAELVGDAERSVSLRLEAAEAFWEAGDRAQTEAMLTTAAAIPIDEPQLRVRAAHLKGRLEARSADVLLGYEILIAGVDLAIHVDPTRASTMLVEAVSAASYAGDLDRVAAGGRRARALAERLTEVPLELDLVIGIADVIDGRFVRGATTLGRAVAEARGEADASSTRWDLAAAAAAFLGDEVAGRDLATRAVARARERGLLASLAQILELQSVLELRGAPAAAEMHASEGLQLAEDTGQVASAAMHLVTLATVAAWRGDREVVLARTGRVLDLAGARALPFWHDKAAAVLALLDLTLGRPQEALDRLESLAANLDHLDNRGGFHRGVPIGAAVDLVEAASRAGTPERGRPGLRLLRAWTSATQTPTAAALHARAQALTGEDEPRAAFERALSFHALSSPGLESARTELLYGEHLRRERRQVEARSHLRNAVEVFDRCRAHPWAERARVELRASGETPSRRTAESAGELTPQERQIADLAADGVPTKAIAGQLFLSPRTVEYHLRKVFTKLDVTSRAQLRGRLPAS